MKRARFWLVLLVVLLVGVSAVRATRTADDLEAFLTAHQASLASQPWPDAEHAGNPR